MTIIQTEKRKSNTTMSSDDGKSLAVDHIGLNVSVPVQDDITQPSFEPLANFLSKTTEPSAESTIATTSSEQYSTWSTGEKRAIILAGSLAGFISPVAGGIYFPALNTIAAALKVPEAKINLTITTFVILQGIAPMMIAGFSDNAGRRPAYTACFTLFAIANLGLALQNSYGALMALRCVQSAGSSSTVALASGLVGDLVTSDERGSYIALTSIGSLLGPVIAPIIGGLISQYADWHWIFWFLLMLGLAIGIPMFFFLPETCRNVVDDGSTPPPSWSWSLTDAIRYARRKKRGIPIDEVKQQKLKKHARLRLPSPMPTFRILADPESLIILLGTAWTVCCYYIIQTGASASLRDVYGFNNIQIALMFCPLAGSGILSVFTTGKLIDWNYRRHARKHGIQVIRGVKQDLTEFPIERARMEISIPMGVLSSLFVIGWGWTMDRKVNLAGPILLMFLFGYTATASFQTSNVLMVDIWPGKAATSIAANNFVRCELGAVATAIIDPMCRAMGRGWAYTTFALVQIAFVPVSLYIMRHGVRMRRLKTQSRAHKRQARQEAGD